MFGICGIIGEKHSQFFDICKNNLEFTKCNSFKTHTFHDCSLGIAKNRETNAAKGSFFSLNGKSIIILGSIINKSEMGYNSDISSEEIVLDLYQSGCLSNLKNANGSFLFVIWDSVLKKLLIGCDRHGTRRLFYKLKDGHFCFSTKISGLCKLEHNNRKINKDSMLDLMVFGYILENRTLVSNIKKLPYASILEFDGANTTLHRYWDWNFGETLSQPDEEQLEEELIRLIRQAIKRRIRNGDNLLLPLSGGLDSRTILGACIELGILNNITTFTYGESGSYDLKIGAQVAHNIGVKHFSLSTDKQDFGKQFDMEAYNVDGMIEAVPFYPILKYKQLYKDYTTIISGQVGGSLFSADSPKKYARFHKTKNKNIIANACLRHHALNDFDQSKLILNLSVDKEQYLQRSGFGAIDDYSLRDLVHFMKYWTCSQRLFHYTPFCNCRFEEIFEYQSPFLDKDLVDFSLKLPQNSLVEQNIYRKSLLFWSPGLFDLPTSRRSGLSLRTNKNQYYLRRVLIKSLQKVNSFSSRLTKRNVTNCKTNKYIDYDNLLRSDMNFQKTIRKLLNGVEDRKLCNQEYIEKLWSYHLSGRGNYFRVFSILLSVEVFSQHYID